MLCRLGFHKWRAQRPPEMNLLGSTWTYLLCLRCNSKARVYNSLFSGSTWSDGWNDE